MTPTGFFSVYSFQKSSYFHIALLERAGWGVAESGDRLGKICSNTLLVVGEVGLEILNAPVGWMWRVGEGLSAFLA